MDIGQLWVNLGVNLAGLNTAYAAFGKLEGVATTALGNITSASNAASAAQTKAATSAANAQIALDNRIMTSRIKTLASIVKTANASANAQIAQEVRLEAATVRAVNARVAAYNSAAAKALRIANASANAQIAEENRVLIKRINTLNAIAAAEAKAEAKRLISWERQMVAHEAALAKRTQREIAAAEASAAASARAAAAMAGNINKASLAFTRFGQSMSMYVTAPLLLIGMGVIKTTTALDTLEHKIVSLTSTSQEQMNAWKLDIKRMSDQTHVASKDITESFYFVANSALSAATTLQIVELATKAAAIGMGTAADVGKVLTYVHNAYGAAAFDAAKAMDSLAISIREGVVEINEIVPVIGPILPYAAKLGVSFDQVGSAMAIMTRAGFNAAKAATAIRAMLSGLADPSQGAQKSLAAMGTSFEELRAIIRDKGLVAALVEVDALMNKYGETTSGELFKNIRGEMAAVGLTGPQLLEFIKVSEKAKTELGSFDKAYKTYVTSIKYSLDGVKVAFQNIFLSIGGSGGGLITFFNSLSAKLNSVANWFKNLTPAMQQHYIHLALWAAAIGPIVFFLGNLIRVVGGLYLAVIYLLSPWPRLIAAFQFLGRTLILVADGYMTLMGVIGITNPWIGLAIAIGVVVAAIGAYHLTQKEVSETQKLMNDVYATSASSIVQEKVKLEQLMRVIQNQNTTQEQKLKAIKDLNAISPEYLGNINLDAVNTGAATEAINKYLVAMEKKARAQAIQNKMVALEEKYIQDIMNGKDKEIKWYQINPFKTEKQENEQNAKQYQKGYEESKKTLQGMADALTNVKDAQNAVIPQTNTLNNAIADTTKQVGEMNRALDSTKVGLNQIGPLTSMLDSTIDLSASTKQVQALNKEIKETKELLKPSYVGEIFPNYTTPPFFDGKGVTKLPDDGLYDYGRIPKLSAENDQYERGRILKDKLIEKEKEYQAIYKKTWELTRLMNNEKLSLLERNQASLELNKLHPELKSYYSSSDEIFYVNDKNQSETLKILKAKKEAEAGYIPVAYAYAEAMQKVSDKITDYGKTVMSLQPLNTAEYIVPGSAEHLTNIIEQSTSKITTFNTEAQKTADILKGIVDTQNVFEVLNVPDNMFGSTYPRPGEISHNNPGNIERSKKRPLLGDVSVEGDRFATFQDMGYGFASQFELLRRYINEYKKTTIEEIISKWAPPTNNKGEFENDTKGYINKMVKWSGIPSTEKIDPMNKDQMIKFVLAQFRAEEGMKANKTDILAGWDIYSQGQTQRKASDMREGVLRNAIAERTIQDPVMMRGVSGYTSVTDWGTEEDKFKRLKDAKQELIDSEEYQKKIKEYYENMSSGESYITGMTNAQGLLGESFDANSERLSLYKGLLKPTFELFGFGTKETTDLIDKINKLMSPEVLSSVVMKDLQKTLAALQNQVINTGGAFDAAPDQLNTYKNTLNKLSQESIRGGKDVEYLNNEILSLTESVSDKTLQKSLADAAMQSAFLGGSFDELGAKINAHKNRIADLKAAWDAAALIGDATAMMNALNAAKVQQSAIATLTLTDITKRYSDSLTDLDNKQKQSVGGFSTLNDRIKLEQGLIDDLTAFIKKAEGSVTELAKAQNQLNVAFANIAVLNATQSVKNYDEEITNILDRKNKSWGKGNDISTLVRVRATTQKYLDDANTNKKTAAAQGSDTSIYDKDITKYQSVIKKVAGQIKFKKVMGGIEDGLQAMQPLMTNYVSLLDAQQNSALSMIQKVAIARHKSEVWVTKQNAKVNEEYAKKKRQMALAEAAVNIAIGVTKAIAQGGILSYLAIPLILAAGALQIAAIKAQPMAEGGVVPSGYRNDTYPALLTSGETVVPPGKLSSLQGGVQRKFKPVVFKIGIRELTGILEEAETLNHSY